MSAAAESTRQAGCDHDHADHVCWGAPPASGHHHRLEVKNLTVRYREVVALDHLNFTTECGRSVALVGPNGAGKSTLLKTLAGLLRPDEGSVLWRGDRLTRASRELAYLPQRGEVDWDFPITVRGLVEMGRYPHVGWWRRFSAHDDEIVARALRAMQLEDLKDRQISALSGGQQQRAFIARALAQEAHVLLLDEPLNGLDKPAQQMLVRLFRELTREGRLLISSHHDLATVADIFDEVLVVNRVEIAFGPVAEVFTPDVIRQAYGG